MSEIQVTHLFSVEQYAKKMLTEGAWGGGIELICFSRCRRINVHVYRVILRIRRTVSPLHCYFILTSPPDVFKRSRLQKNNNVQ
jgi:hypothetical protein